jgi:hypothetical protein
MISRDDYFKGRDKQFPNEFTDDVLKNADKIIARASELLSAFGEKRKVSSGWRPTSINKQVGGAKNSQHIYGNAVDIEDKDGRLKKFCVENIERLIEIGLWMEDVTATPTWVHLQSVPPKSGDRIFKP